jgi:hypothetical protein
MRPERVRALGLAAGLALGLAGRLGASGGGTLDWLSGTPAWDTTPYCEADLQASACAQGDSVWAGLGAQAGVTDWAQVSALWNRPPGPGDALGELGLRLREPVFPRYRPAFSAYGRLDDAGNTWAWWDGVAADWEPLDATLAAAAEAGAGHVRQRLAGWTPYVLPTLRLGVETSWLDARAEAWTPQIEVNAPGDLSLQVGARLSAAGGSPLWTLRLSYELFPNP